MERQRRQSGSGSGDEQVTGFHGATNEESAHAIVDGVHAWKALTKGEGPLWQQFNKETRDKASRRQSFENAGPESEKGVLREDSQPVDSDNQNRDSCPFDALAHIGETQNTKQRPESLPTPPPTQEQFSDRHIPSNSRDISMSPPPSNSGSASKCPIRMLDERSPEEIALYFETHKHEIPRSHEVCVKRYQSNAQSIRQLDAKYGSLVNMLHGLGMKHQPMLPVKEDEEDFGEVDAKSARKVEKWAGDVNKTDAPTSTGQDLRDGSILDHDERQPHFNRPLKEIRLGESPSRPWGISVPLAGPLRDFDPDEATYTPKMPTLKAAPQPTAKKSTNEEPEAPTEGKPRILITGPVFMGYSAEDAATLIQKCGWDPQASKGTND